jgi:hypothetical protein
MRLTVRKGDFSGIWKTSKKCRVLYVEDSP